MSQALSHKTGHKTRPHPLPLAEFVILMAATMSLAAFAIDAMLPALGIIASDFALSDANDNQFVIVLLFAGIGLGQIFYGPLSDSIGRKRSFYIGLSLFVIGSLIAWQATAFHWLLLGRFIQGLGAAGSRVISRAIIRDLYSGRVMAKIMSIIMSLFILVPAIAPTVGQVILWVGDWRDIFLAFIVFGTITLLWLGIRLPESLDDSQRRPLKLASIAQGIKEVMTHRVSLGYGICSGLTFGSLVGYLNSAQPIFQRYYDTGDQFAFYFGAIALAIGAAALVNARIVERLGMRYIVQRALILLVATSVIFIFLMLVVWGVHQVPLWCFMAYALITFFCLGLSFGNFNALAMEPMGHMAGLASSVIGSLSTFVSLALGTLIGQLYSGNLLPVSIGFFALALSALALMRWVHVAKAQA